MTEKLISGYCRVLNAARTVLADCEDRSADCRYPDCEYREECPIAAQLRDFLDKEVKK